MNDCIAEALDVRHDAAFKKGRIVTDVVMDLSGSAFQLREAGALIPLNDPPGYKNFPEQVRQPDHITVAARLRCRCMSYNTGKVKKEDIPKTWDDLVASDKFGSR